MLKWLLSALVWFQSPVLAADVYVWFDSQGLANYADRALNDQYLLLFRDAEQTPSSPKMQSVPQGRTQAKVIAPPVVQDALREASIKHGVAYELLHAVALVESGFNSNAVSPKGAVGLMQLMPATAQRYGIAVKSGQSISERLLDIQVNANAGSSHLSDLLQRFKGNTALALAAYNAGEGAVTRAGNRVPDYDETRAYVQKVMSLISRPTEKPPTSDLVNTDCSSSKIASSVTLFKGADREIQVFERGFADMSCPVSSRH